MNEEMLSHCVIGAAIEVHKYLGPGLLESVYARCLAAELALQNIPVELEVAQGVTYKGIYFDAGYRLDLLVDKKVVVELKVVEKLLPVHEAQLLSYLRLSGMKLGLLINFHVPRVKDGIKRLVNNL